MIRLILIAFFLSAGTSYADTLTDVTNYGEMLAAELGIEHVRIKMSYDSPVYLATHFTKEIDGIIVFQQSVALSESSTTTGISFLYRIYPFEPIDDTAVHRFRVTLSNFEKDSDGNEKEIERQLLQQNQPSKDIRSTSSTIKTFLFNGNTPLPRNTRVSFFKILDSNGIDGKDVLYSIDFEVSDKPIEQ